MRLNKFFTELAVRIKLDSAEASQLAALGQEHRIVVYAFRRQSWFEVRLWQEVCKRLGLPQGEVFFMRKRLGYELSVSWVKAYRASRKLKLDAMLNTETVVVPISMSIGFGPKSSFYYLKYLPDFDLFPALDFIKILRATFSRVETSVKLGPNIVTNRELNYPANSSDFFRAISLSLYKHEKSTRGVRASNLAETILGSEVVESQINVLSVQTGASRQQIYAQARKCFNEISASVSPLAVKFLYVILRPIIRTVFSKIQVNGIDQLRQTIKDSPTVVVPSHRSHFDYLLIGWIFLHADLPIPYVAAGSNLNFFPVGRILKSAGAFFIRRKSHGDLIYKIVLSTYLNYLVKVGHVITFYIEGGRSRSGSMLNPKLGILKYLVRTWLEEGRKDIYFAPVSISYEKVAEEQALTRELGGAKKKSESFWELLKVGRIWEKRFGEVVVNISTPFSLLEFELQTQAKPSKSEVDVGLLTEDLGYHMSRVVMSKTALTSTSMLALAAMSFDSYSISYDQLLARLVAQYDFMVDGHQQELGFVSDYVLVTLKKMQPNAAMESLVLSFCNQGLAKVEQGSFILNTEKLLLVDYYKNNIFQHVFPVAILGVCFENGKFSQSRLHVYHQLFKPYFLLSHWRNWKEEQNVLLEKLYLQGSLGKDNEDYFINDYALFEIFKNLLSPFFESFYMLSKCSPESLDDFLLTVRKDGFESSKHFRLESFSKTYLEFAYKQQKRIAEISTTTGLSVEQVSKLMFEVAS